MMHTPCDDTTLPVSYYLGYRFPRSNVSRDTLGADDCSRRMGWHVMWPGKVNADDFVYKPLSVTS